MWKQNWTWVFSPLLHCSFYTTLSSPSIKLAQTNCFIGYLLVLISESFPLSYSLSVDPSERTFRGMGEELLWFLTSSREVLSKQYIIVGVCVLFPLVGTPLSFFSVWWWLNLRRQWKVSRLAQQQTHSRWVRCSPTKKWTLDFLEFPDSSISWA